VQTFTRASTATYIDPLDGLVKTAVNDTPRFERMADDGTGILLEGASTNYLPHSGMNSGLSFWQIARTTGNTTLAPDGITNIEAFTTSVANANDPQMQQSVNIGSAVGGVTFTQSVFIKGSGVSIGKMARLFLFVGGSHASKAVALTADWVRVELTYTGVAGSTSSTVTARVDIINVNIDPVAGTDIVYCWGHQVEKLPFASSYIPTTTAAVTRAADNLSLAVSGNVLDNLKDATVICDIDTLASNNAINQVAWSVFGETYRMLMLTHVIGTYIHNGSSANTAFTSPMLANSVSRIASLNSSLLTTGYKDGVLGTPTPLNTIPVGGVASIVKLGEWNGNYPMYGHIRNFRIYDQALTAIEIAAA